MNCSNFKVFHSNFFSDEIINRVGGVLQGAPVPNRAACQPAWQVNESGAAGAGHRSIVLALETQAPGAGSGCCRVHNINNNRWMGSLIYLKE